MANFHRNADIALTECMCDLLAVTFIAICIATNCALQLVAILSKANCMDGVVECITVDSSQGTLRSSAMDMIQALLEMRKSDSESTAAAAAALCLIQPHVKVHHCPTAPSCVSDP
jgi:hypothetical protein